MVKFVYFANVFTTKNLFLVILKVGFKNFKKLHKPAPIN